MPASPAAEQAALRSRLAFGWREGLGPVRLAWGNEARAPGALSAHPRFFQQGGHVYPQSLWTEFRDAAPFSLENDFTGDWEHNPTLTEFPFSPPRDLLARPAWDRYCARIEAAFTEGSLQKVVPARPVFHALSTELVDKLRAELLDRLFAVPQEGSHRFVLHHGKSTFFGATPELLFRRRGGKVFVPAIAGTRVISAEKSLEAASAELQASEKEQREHAFVVEGIRTALSSLGLNPTAPAAPTILRARNLVHLFTPVEAEDNGLDSETLVAALHPTPAVGGTPKEAAARFLADGEPWERGLFASPLLLSSDEGALALVTIRSGLLRPEGLYLFAGAGYVPGSRADAEWEETARKMDSLRSLLREGR